MKRLNIDLGERSYEILIGRNLLERTREFVSEILKPSRVVIVTHPSLHRLYGETLAANLAQGGTPTEVIEVPEGESSKSLQQAEKIYDRLLEWKCDRQTLLVALGGGVIGDLTGFIAATYVRGIPFLQIPTSLLAQVDSSVGGKTAVNHPRGKNMIGAFYQPRLVIIDLETLRTLPQKEFRAGMAEIIKHGIIEDPGLFDYLETHFRQILEQETESLQHIIAASCAIKASVVEKDERESRYRMVLNFGHTIGHALESLTGYTSLIHGEAVAIGMVHAALLSRITGHCGPEIPRRIAALVETFGLPTRLPPLDPGDIIQSMYLDKKTAHNKIRFILVKDIGSIEIVDDVPEHLIRQALEED
ncbi:MAG: 3-dehydroquinate synthase [Nitrospinaceae bacterium]